MESRPCSAAIVLAAALGACAPQEMIARYGDGGVGAPPMAAAYPESPVLAPYPDPMLFGAGEIYPGAGDAPPGFAPAPLAPAALGAAPPPWPRAPFPPGAAGSTGRSHLPLPGPVPRPR